MASLTYLGSINRWRCSARDRIGYEHTVIEDDPMAAAMMLVDKLAEQIGEDEAE